jgi:hypothetical protein
VVRRPEQAPLPRPVPPARRSPFCVDLRRLPFLSGVAHDE